tara:strand:+ start:45468 stop:46391 length:924 start_codon:yes stop_codon:yes gene_type:complete
MESENNLKNFPVFIVGMPRSGTTILSNLLNATQNIYFPPETHYYQLIKKFYSKKSKNPYLDFINLTRNKYFSEFKFSDYEIDNLKNLIINYPKSQISSELLKKICISKSLEKNIKRWGEKTPIHFYFLNKIFSDFQDCKVINVIRDPRDVIASNRSAKWKRIFDLHRKLVQYKNNYKYCHSYPETKVLNIKYEDLVSKPNVILKKVCKFLEINYNPKIMDTFYKKKHLNFDVQNEPWKVNNLKPLTTKNIYKWKKQQFTFENKYISWFCRREIRLYNYEKNVFPPIYICIFFQAYITLKSFLLNFRL